MLVEDSVIVELKCVEAFTRIHEAQLLSYLKLSGKNVGLLINFHVAHLRDGIKRLVNGRGWDRPFLASVPSVVKSKSKGRDLAPLLLAVCPCCCR